MKKHAVLLAIAVIAAVNVSAQSDKFYGLFNRVGADVNVGSQGLGFDIATPATSYLELSVGLNYMPGFKISGDVDVNDITVPSTPDDITIPMGKVNIEGGLARTTLNFKVSCYPFGEKNDFFVAAGFSYAGNKIARLKGHSDDVKAFMDNPDYPQSAKDNIYAEIDKYNVQFDENGDVNGRIKVNGFRPYLGLGYGRYIPKHRFGFRVELGCQFHGHMKIYQNDQEVKIDDLRGSSGTSDDLSDIVDKLTVYPVLKFSLTGRIL